MQIEGFPRLLLLLFFDGLISLQDARMQLLRVEHLEEMSAHSMMKYSKECG